MGSAITTLRLSQCLVSIVRYVLSFAMLRLIQLAVLILVSARSEAFSFPDQTLRQLHDLHTDTLEDTGIELGEWSEWSDWSPCSVSCGGGTRNRRKTCSGSKCLEIWTDTVQSEICGEADCCK